LLFQNELILFYLSSSNFWLSYRLEYVFSPFR